MTDKFFISKHHIAKLEVIDERFKVSIYTILFKNKKPLIHPEDYENPTSTFFFTEFDSATDFLRDYVEYDPDIIDHNDPDVLFKLDIGEVD